MFMQNFSSPASTQTDLDKFLTFFQEKIRIFQENTEANCRNFQNQEVYQLTKHVHAKFQHSSIYPDGIRFFLNTFSRKFQNFSEKLLSEFQKIQI
jgi:hypothetical protein